MNRFSKPVGIFLGLSIAAAYIFFMESNKPPVAMAVRDSAVGQGKVIILTNISDKKLHQISISAESAQSSRNFGRKIVAITLDPHESVEAGWMELGQGFEAGDIVYVGAEGYLRSVKRSVP